MSICSRLKFMPIIVLRVISYLFTQLITFNIMLSVIFFLEPNINSSNLWTEIATSPIFRIKLYIMIRIVGINLLPENNEEENKCYNGY